MADLITPLIAAIFGKPNFNDLSFTLNHSVRRLHGAFSTDEGARLPDVSRAAVQGRAK